MNDTTRGLHPPASEAGLRRSFFWAILVIVGAFLLRLALLDVQTAEYTDGIDQLRLFVSHKSFWPPLYAALVRLVEMTGLAPERAGRLVSAFFGSLALLPTFLLARRIFSPKTGLFAVILGMVCAVSLRWDTKVMTDSSFTALFVTGWWLLARFLERRSAARFGLFLAVAGLATLTRYEGFVFLPFLAVAAALLFDGFRRPVDLLRGIGWSLLGLVPWGVLLWWLSTRGFGHFAQYSKRAGHDFMGAIQSYFIMAEAFLIALPWALTAPVAIFCAVGALDAVRGSRRRRAAMLVMALLFLAWLVAHSAFKAFQIRYFYPLFPLFLILAAHGIRCTSGWACSLDLRRFKRYGPFRGGMERCGLILFGAFERLVVRFLRMERVLLAICFLSSALLSGLVLYYQRDSFGGIKRAAYFLREEVPRKARILSDETTKLSYWSGRRIRKNRTDRLRRGDYVVFNDFYTANLRRREKRLQKRYRLRKVFEDRSELVPLLPDIMTHPRYKMHHPGWIVYKFRKQRFRTVVYHVEGKKRRPPARERER